MRDLLTYLGIALILILSAAFAAPLLIDFDSYRPRIADELTQATGAQIRLDGPIELRLLPTPRFSAENVEATGAFGRLRADKALFALSLPALLQGRLQFSRARLDGAEIVIDADKAQRPARAAAGFDNLSLRRADVTILRGGAPVLHLAGLGVSAQIGSLDGPIAARGEFDWRGRSIGFSLASDVARKNLLPLKASLTAPDGGARLELDGGVDLAGPPAFEGQAKASGAAPPGPWAAQGDTRISLDGAFVKDVSVTLGEGPMADKLSGGARYETAGGKHVLDADAPTLSSAWAEFFAARLPAMAGDGPFDLRVAIESLAWRGATWSRAQAVWRTGAPAQVSFSGPGATQVEVSAAPEARGWRGKAQLKSADFSAFAAALRAAAPGIGPELAGVGFRAMEIGGDFVVTPEEWALTGASLALDAARLTGDIRLRPATADANPLLIATLAAPALDLDALPDFGGAPFGGLDFDLSLEARTIKAVRGGALSGDSGRIKAHLLRVGVATWLERLEMRNIVGGADLTASAAWGRDLSGLEGEARLKANDLAPLAQALARVLPGSATKALAARAKSLSPADLAGKAGDGGFTLNGVLGATRLGASVLLGTGQQAITVDLTAPEAGALLNQLGAQTVWTQRLGPAKLSARTENDPLHSDSRLLTASADVAGLRGEFHGALQDVGNDDAKSVPQGPKIDGDATLAGDAGKTLGAFSGAPAAIIPLRLAARASWRDGALSLRDLDGEWAGARISGGVSAGPGGVTGALTCSRFSVPEIAALVLGPPAPVKAGALWSSLSFAPAMLDPPRSTLTIATDDLQPLGARARFDLALGAGILSVAHGELDILDGVVRGGFDLRRDGGQVTLSGEAEGQDLALKNPALTARLDGKLKFAGSGGAASALIGSLAGEGTASLRDLVVEGVAPGAVDQALTASENSDAPFDAREVAKSLDAAFAREPLIRGQANFTLRLAGGQIGLAPADAGGQGIEAGFDLRDATMSLGASSIAQGLPSGWSGAPPRGAVIWSGPWRTPARRIDAAAFVNAVAIRALEREQARVEKIKQQDRERLRALSADPAPQPVPAPAQ